MGLFKPAWMSNNKEKALNAVKKATDQLVLLEIIKDAPINEVRLAAVEKITDKETLFEIAWNNNGIPIEVCDAAIDKINDETLILKLAKEYKFDTIRRKAVERLNNQKELLQIIISDESRYVRAAAIKNLDGSALDYGFLKKFAVRAESAYHLEPEDGLAAVERISDEKTLCEIACVARSTSVQSAAAAKIIDENILADLLIRTDNRYLFEEIAERVSNPELRKKIVQEAKISDKDVLKKLIEPKELLQKCLDEKNASLVESVYKETWDIDILKRLREISGSKDLTAKIDLRIKTAEHMKMLREKGMPAVLNERTDDYISSLETEINRYGLAKKTVNEQGRQLAFDDIYDKSDLQDAVLSSAGISLQYFHGMLSGLLFNNYGVSIQDNAKEAVWAVIARLQLADSEEVLKRIKPNISQEEASGLIHDILRLWYIAN